MAPKAKTRLAPRLNEAALHDTFAAQLAHGAVTDARVAGVTLKSLCSDENEPARLNGCLLDDVKLLDPQAHGMRMQDVRWRNCDLAQWDLRGGVLERVEIVNARLTGVTMTEVRLRSVLFRDCKLNFALFRMAKLELCTFEDCNLTDADFYAADLTGTVFRKCNLSRVDFSGARMAGADLRGSELDAVRGKPATADGLKIDGLQAPLLIGMFGVEVVW